MASVEDAGSKDLALQFTRALCDREYATAYDMTAADYRAETSQGDLRTEFEEMIPSDWGSTEPIEVSETMTEWPENRPDDVLWAYVSISGDVYTEAVIVIVSSENDELKIRTVELGRP